MTPDRDTRQVREACIGLEDPRRWRAALDGVPHAVGHTWDYCRAVQLTSLLPTYLYVHENANVRIVCPLAEREIHGCLDAVTPYGFSGFTGTGPCVEFPERWRTFAQARGYVCAYIGLHPRFEEASLAPPADVFAHNHLFVLDLALGMNELFTNLSANRKRQLKEWDRIRSTLVLDRDHLIEFLLRTYAEFFRRKHAAAAYEFSVETMAGLAAMDRTLLVGAGPSGRLAAVSLFAWTEHGGEFLFNVSLPEGAPYSAALLWYAVEALHDRGVPWLNLGGGVRDGDRLTEFKRRFGGSPLPLRALKQVYDPTAYARLCREAGADPADRTGYFPAYRRARP